VSSSTKQQGGGLCVVVSKGPGGRVLDFLIIFAQHPSSLLQKPQQKREIFKFAGKQSNHRFQQSIHLGK